MALNANRTWFNISMQGNFSVYAFSGKEEVCKPYEFDIELVSPSGSEPIAEIIGTKACLSIADRSGDVRLVHGIIASMEQGHTGNRYTYYYCKVVPRLYFLNHISDNRIFQNLSVPDIIQKILNEQGFTGTEVKFSLFFKYEPREYCVQYNETDVHFITRLCEEEGIYFYFEHKENEHTLCFCDREGAPPIAGESDIRYYPGGEQTPDTAVVSDARYRLAVNSNAAAYREWNFQKPRLNLEVTGSGDGPAPGGMLLEQYRYPHIYELQATGNRYAQLQVLRQLTFKERLDVKSDVSRYLPAFSFSIHEHPRSEVNAQWWVTAVRHKGEQPGVLQHEAPDARGMTYQSTVTAIPDMTRFIPQLEHPKSRIEGLQSAIVTGPENEEVYADQYGRVKVQFHWDRLGRHDETTTCWIRVSQGWAGTQYGTMAIPRIGNEVIVSFLEGNPDRPLITGSVYHELNRVPYALPEHKTRTVFKSMSTPGKENEPRGFNELRIEDKAGEEEMYLHAEKDVNTYTKNDWKDHILHDRHQTVDNCTYLETKGETHETLIGERKTEIHSQENLTVHAERHTAIKNSDFLRVTENVHTKSGQRIIFEAGTEILFKVGNSFLKVDSAGVWAKPRLEVGGNGGSATMATPNLPKATKTPPSGQSPECQSANLKQANALCLPTA